MEALTGLRRLEINGGEVTESRDGARLQISAGATRYTNAQLDDYGGRRRRAYPWGPGTRLSLRARFNRPPAEFVGTAGFGFWNAPFGDPTTRWPALPRAAWFFYGSPPNDFPLAPAGPGRGWFAGTIDALRPQALSLAPAAPAVLLLNRWPAFRARFWPRIQRRLGISFQPLALDWCAWHEYELVWGHEQTTFRVDGQPVLAEAPRPGGPLGFVCWVDNQYLQVTATGRIRAGILPVAQPQMLEIAGLKIAPAPPL